MAALLGRLALGFLPMLLKKIAPALALGVVGGVGSYGVQKAIKAAGGGLSEKDAASFLFRLKDSDEAEFFKILAEGRLMGNEKNVDPVLVKSLSSLFALEDETEFERVYGAPRSECVEVKDDEGNVIDVLAPQSKVDYRYQIGQNLPGHVDGITTEENCPINPAFLAKNDISAVPPLTGDFNTMVNSNFPAEMTFPREKLPAEIVDENLNEDSYANRTDDLVEGSGLVSDVMGTVIPAVGRKMVPLMGKLVKKTAVPMVKRLGSKMAAKVLRKIPYKKTLGKVASSALKEGTNLFLKDGALPKDATELGQRFKERVLTGITKSVGGKKVINKLKNPSEVVVKYLTTGKGPSSSDVGLFLEKQIRKKIPVLNAIAPVAAAATTSSSSSSFSDIKKLQDELRELKDLVVGKRNRRKNRKRPAVPSFGKAHISF